MKPTGPTREIQHVATRAFVLRVVDYGDSDQIVTLLTEEFGKLTAEEKSAALTRSVRELLHLELDLKQKKALPGSLETVEVKVGDFKSAQLAVVESGEAGKHGADGERCKLGIGWIDAKRAAGDLVFPQRLPGPSHRLDNRMGAVDESTVTIENNETKR